VSAAAVSRLHEEPFFHELEGEQLFCFLHRAVGSAKGTIVLCHAFAEEKLWSHRVYVTFGRDAARAGYNVLRFDMRGEGDSSREFEETSIETRVQDVLAAAKAASLRCGESRTFLLGHRLGGSIAAVAASRAGGAVHGVAIWDPIPDGEDYFGSLLRSNMATQMATAGKVTRTRDALLKAISDGEVIVVDGYGLTAALHREMSALRWQDMPGLLMHPTLLLEVPKGEQTAPQAVFVDLKSTRPGLHAALVPEPPFWRETRQFHQRAPLFTRATLEWLENAST
jgi:pimeloyl-ACP methyl ester carboxylesterase